MSYVEAYLLCPNQPAERLVFDRDRLDDELSSLLRCDGDDMTRLPLDASTLYMRRSVQQSATPINEAASFGAKRALGHPIALRGDVVVIHNEAAVVEKRLRERS